MTTSSTTQSSVEQLLEKVVQKAFSDKVVKVRDLAQLSAGASAETWKIRADIDSNAHDLIVRRDPDQRFICDSISKHLEVLAQTAVNAMGVPVPKIIYEFEQADGLGEGYLMYCEAGEALPTRILRDSQYSGARARLVEQAATILARLHATPTDRLQALPRMCAVSKLVNLRRLYQNLECPSLVFDYAFDWLERHADLIPTPDTTLVHGDYRLGNFLVDKQGLKCVLDWELCHLGDPAEDLAYICVNAWRFGQVDHPVAGLGQRTAFLRAYQQHGGRIPSDESLLLWEMMGNLHWGLICMQQACKEPGQARRSLEQVAIGRRVAEVELDLLNLITYGVESIRDVG